MERQRLVDGPDPAPGLALADGRERRADRGRVVAVVVVHDDAADLALALEPAADAARTTRARRRSRSAPQRPGADAAAATPSAFATLCAPAVGRRTATGPRSSSRPIELDASCRRLVAAVDPAEQHAGRTGRRRELLGDAPGVAPGAARLDVRDRDGDDRPGQSARRAATRSAPGSPMFATSDRRLRRPRPHAPDPALERVDDGVARRRRRRGGPTPMVVRIASAGRYGVEVAGVLVGLDDERRVRPAAMRRRRRAAVIPRGSSAPTNADGSRPASARTWTSQPAVVLLPCVPATPTRGRPAAASATTCCHGSSGMPSRRAASQLGVVRGDRGQGLRHREPVRGAAPGPRRGTGRAPRPSACRRRRAPSCTARGRPGSQPLTSAPAQARGRAAALAPAPAMPRTWIRSPARIGRAVAGRARGRRRWTRPRSPARARASAVAPTRSSSSSSTAAALETLFAARSPRPEMPPDLDAVARRPRPRTSARPASPRSRRRGRRSR